MPQPVMRTKLHIPSVRPEAVLRRRLSARLDEGLRSKLILISAPAGFGKTTALAAWAKQIRAPVAWLSLDASDNDPLQYQLYSLAALQSAVPGLGASVQAIIESGFGTAVEPALAALINELDQLSDHVFLILDDYHVIDNEMIHKALLFLLDHLPLQVHIVIATRVDPPFSLARMRARGELVELRETDLRFSSSETLEFLNQRMGLALSSADVETLESRTEGWAAGLQLAALAMQGRSDLHDFVRAFSGSHHFILEYFVEEVLKRQTEPERRFLLCTSVLNRLCGRLCDVLTGGEGGEEMLADLHRRHLFITPLDDEHRWYRYHHLLADLLMAKLMASEPERVPALYMAASKWCHREGHIAEAVAYALAAGKFEPAAILVERHAIALFNEGRLAEIMNLVRQLPADLVGTRPWLNVFHAFMLVTNGQLEGVDAILQRAEEQIPADDSSPEMDDLAAAVAAVQAQVANMRGELDGAIALNHVAHERVTPGNLLVRMHIHYSLGDIYFKRGDLVAADHTWSEGLEIGRGSKNSLLFLPSLYDLAHLRRVQGQLHAARQLYAEAEEMIRVRNEGSARVVCPLEVGLGELLYEWNDLEGAAHHTARGIEMSQLHGTASSLAIGHLTMMRIRLAQNDREEARASLRAAEETAHGYRVLKNIDDQVGVGRVRFWLAEGSLDKATGWAGRQAANVEAAYVALEPGMTLARVEIARGMAGVALERLAHLKQFAMGSGRGAGVIEALILIAVAHYRDGHTDCAVASLEEAVLLGAPDGFVRTFVEEGETVAALLRQIARTRPSSEDYVQLLLAAFSVSSGASEQAPSAAQPLIEALTEREHQVLVLICDGLSNRQIAEALIIAPNTVKKHTTNIYGKLDVSSRTQAIVKAQELDLV